jgi:hypothetical protein
LGLPNGLPSGKGTHSERGGCILSAFSRTKLMPVVMMPSLSK